LVEKVEGAEMTCRACGTDLICRMKEYKGDFAPKLQWQNEDGTAHYNTKDGKNFTCNIPDVDGQESKPTQKSSTIPKTNSLDEDMRYIKNKVDLMFAMISEQYKEYIDRKNQS